MYVHVAVAVAEPVVDGSGAVTGLAFYRLQQDKLIVDREYESLKNKFQRLRSEYTLEKERHSKEKYVCSYVQY